jgi:antitoxin component YwqK of YwqJK toxin-antitoxin module
MNQLMRLALLKSAISIVMLFGLSSCSTQQQLHGYKNEGKKIDYNRISEGDMEIEVFFNKKTNLPLTGRYTFKVSKTARYFASFKEGRLYDTLYSFNKQQLKQRLIYQNGVLNGESVTYDKLYIENKNRSDQFITTYKNGLAHGIEKTIEDTTLIQLSSFQNGIKVGLEYHFDEGGDTIGVIRYDHDPSYKQPDLSMIEFKQKAEFIFYGKIEIHGVFPQNGSKEVALFELVSISTLSTKKYCLVVNLLYETWICFYNAQGLVYSTKLD